MTLVETIADRLENAEQLDRPAAALTSFWSKALSPRALRDLLSGTPIGHPLHPAAVLVPAGTLLSATVCDAASQPEAAQLLTAAGVVAAVPTVLAGWSDWVDTEQAEKRVGLVHAAFNAAGITAYAISWYARRRGGRGLGGSLVGASLLGVGGWLGGHLSYAQGVGVDTTAFETGPSEWTDVAATDDVTASLQRVEVDGVGLLLTRVAGRPVAISDRCTHRGAPLSDGERSGDCVVCPWHASEFDLTDGHVVHGPATRPQPAYEVREQDGRVEVRRVEPRALRTNPA